MSFLNDIVTENSNREVDASFTNFLHGYKKMKSLSNSLNEESRRKELLTFIESTSSLSSQIPAIKRTLFKHYKRGEYNSPLAERAWSRLVTEGAKKYARDVGKEPRLWEDMLPEGIRSSIVEEFEANFYNDLKKGKVNMEELFNE